MKTHRQNLRKKISVLKKADKEEASNEYEKGEIRAESGKRKESKEKFYGYGCDQQAEKLRKK